MLGGAASAGGVGVAVAAGVAGSGVTADGTSVVGVAGLSSFEHAARKTDMMDMASSVFVYDFMGNLQIIG